jgi:hypothetical protein
MWTINDYADDKRGYIRITDGDLTICDIFPFAFTGGVGREAARENARKIVNADQLYDALKQLIDYVIDGCPDGSYIAVIEAKAALSNIRSVVPCAPTENAGGEQS